MMDFDALYLRTLKFLNFRPRSEKEIRDYLKKILSPIVIASKAKQSYISREEIAASQAPRNDETLTDLIIHKLKQQRFLNDLEFAKMWVRSRTEFRPKGERLIRLELKQKGISKELIDEAFQSFDFASFGSAQDKQEESLKSSRSDKELAADLLARKRKKYEGMEPMERFHKAGSMLARRGFDLDDIKWAIDQVFGKMV